MLVPMTDPRNLEGGCLCGGVRYTYVGELDGNHGSVTICHCGQCRKAQGGPAAVAPVAAKGLQFVSGEDLIQEYQSSAGKFRAFCGRCGSPLYSRRAAFPAILRLRLGSLGDAMPKLNIDARIFFQDRASWEDSAAVAPAYPAEEPGRS